MSSFPAVIGASALVLEAGASLLDAHIGALPVLDGRRLAGLVTKSDILRLASSPGFSTGGVACH
jgi:CBS domain-containing protein